MDDASDPALAFFTEEELESPTFLYTVLALLQSEPQPTKAQTSAVTQDDIKKAYRQGALRCHPDKHVNKSDEEREKQGREFQRIGFAYSVLSDEAKRKRYDLTGSTSNHLLDEPDIGWDAYFKTIYQRVDKKMLDEDKKRYQGSEEEISDLHSAYISQKGSFPDILSHIPHSTPEDESRFLATITKAISSGELPEFDQWAKTSKDEKARRGRKNEAKKEAEEAEQAAKELGVWEEFYGNGAAGAKGTSRSKGTTKKRKATSKDEEEEGEEDISALASIIAKRNASRQEAMDAMLKKYETLDAEEREGKKGKKRRKGKVEEEAEAEPTEEEFEALQAKLFGENQEAVKSGAEGKRKSSRKAQKVKA